MTRTKRYANEWGKEPLFSALLLGKHVGSFEKNTHIHTETNKPTHIIKLHLGKPPVLVSHGCSTFNNSRPQREIRMK